MYLKKILLASLLYINFTYAQNTVGININNDDVEVFTSFNFNDLVDYTNGTNYLLNVNYIHSNTDNMTQVSLLGKNYLQGTQNVSLSFGIQSIVASDFLAFAFSATGYYALPLIDTIPPSSLSIHLAYAPEVLSYRDAKNYLEFRVEADMEVISNVHVFTGYRNINTNYNTYNKTFNDSIYAGMKLQF